MNEGKVTEWEEAQRIAERLRLVNGRNSEVGVLARQFLAATDRIAALEARTAIVACPTPLGDRIAAIEADVAVLKGRFAEDQAANNRRPSDFYGMTGTRTNVV